METEKFKLQRVFLGSKRFTYMDMKEYVRFSNNGIDFPLPFSMRNDSRHNVIQVPVETLNELSVFTTGKDYNGNDANMGYLVIEPKIRGDAIKFETLLQRHPKIKQIFDHNTGYTPGKKSNTKSSLFVVEMFFLDKSREMKKFDQIGMFMKI